MTTKDDEDELLRSVALQNANSILMARQRAEQRREAYLAEAQRLSHTGSFGWRPSTGEIFWSEETFRIFQYDRTMIPTVELVAQRVHPDDEASARQTIERALQDGTDFDFEHRLLMPDGSVKYVRNVARALSDESGGLEFVGAVMDVTAAKEAEDRIRLIINAVPALIWTARADGRLDFISQRWLDYAGIDIGAIASGELGERTVHPDDIEQLRNKWRAAVAEGNPFEAEIRVRRFDGEYRWFLSRACPLRDRTGHILGWYGNDIDIEDRKRAEEALRQSESNLAEAQRLTHMGSWAWRVVGREALHLSEEWYRIYGFNPEEGMPTWEERLQRIHPEDRAKWRGAIDRAIAEKSDYEVEFRITLPGGTVKYIHTVGHPVLSASGDLLEFVGSATDITERKRAEVLLAGEKRLLEMIATGDSLDLILDAVCRLVEGLASDSLSSILLLDPNGNRLRHGAAPSLPTPYTAAIDGLVIGPSVGSCGTAAYRAEPVIVSDIATDPLWTDFRDLALAHGLRACWSTPILSTTGKVLGTFAIYYREPRSPVAEDHSVIRQLTHLASIAVERKQAEQKLRQSEAYLHEAQRLGRTGSWAHNPSSGTFFASPELFRIFGYDPSEGKLTGEMLGERIHPEDLQLVKQRLTKAMSEKTDWESNYRILLPDGSMRHLHSVAHPVLDRAGTAVEYIGTVMDVTERKQAEETLSQVQADLAHATRVTTMGELTASLAHEVNQPIAAAVTNGNTCLRWLAHDPPDLEEARAAATRIVKDGTRAGEIISRIRLLFKKGTPQPELVDVNEVVREMIVILRGETTRYSISVRTELAEDLPQVMGDRVQLQQVLMNLMMNSIDAMKDAQDTRELAIKSQRTENEQLMVSVTDTGVGLPPLQGEQIFNAFFTTKPQGTGMGLRISRSIVESHGGRLWAADNSPRGASFNLILPAELGDSQPNTAESATLHKEVA
jgi:PAS domain S-box-containing protein